MSSRLEARRCIITTPSPGNRVGDVLYVLGNALPVADAGAAYFLEIAKLSGRRNGNRKPRKRTRDPVPVDAPYGREGARRASRISARP